MAGPIEVAGLTISRNLVTHPLLGEAHPILQGDRVLTHVSTIDWDRPTQIPAIAMPAALPPTAGTQLLNLIAQRALAAGVPALRYAGPYPTSALFRALVWSFRTTSDEAAFTAHALDRAARVARDEVPVDFVPAPHRRIEHPYGTCLVRDGLERATIAGVSYERSRSPGRLVAEGARWAAEVWFGEAPWARVALVDADGQLLDGPHAIPAASSSVLGTQFPAPLAEALGDLVGDYLPEPMAAPAKQMLTRHSIVWTDLGASAARQVEGRFEVHVGLWEHVAPLGMARLARALAEALAPVVGNAIIAAAIKSSALPPVP